MNRQKSAKAELLPMQPPDARADIERFIEQKLTEITSGNSETIFEPWFRNKLLADAIKRCQTVPEQQKWSHYFAEWGCLICAKTDERHMALGMCAACYMRTKKRVQAIIKTSESNQGERTVPTDLADKAHEAIRRTR